MLDPQGYVAECTGENIFLVRRGVLYTPPSATVLEGITRDSLMALLCQPADASLNMLYVNFRYSLPAKIVAYKVC